jgi:hypothetical protein
MGFQQECLYVLSVTQEYDFVLACGLARVSQVAGVYDQ